MWLKLFGLFPIPAKYRILFDRTSINNIRNDSKERKKKNKKKERKSLKKGILLKQSTFFLLLLSCFWKKVSQLILDPAGIKKLSDTVLPNLSGSPQKIQTASLPIFPSFQHVFNAWRSQEEEETKAGRPVESTHTGWLGINWTDLFKPFIFRDAPPWGTC